MSGCLASFASGALQLRFVLSGAILIFILPRRVQVYNGSFMEKVL